MDQHLNYIVFYGNTLYNRSCKFLGRGETTLLIVLVKFSISKTGFLRGMSQFRNSYDFVGFWARKEERRINYLK